MEKGVGPEVPNALGFPPEFVDCHGSGCQDTPRDWMETYFQRGRPGVGRIGQFSGSDLALGSDEGCLSEVAAARVALPRGQARNVSQGRHNNEQEA